MVWQGAVNFAITTSSATRVALVLFTEADLQEGRTTIEIELHPEANRTGDIWHMALPKLDASLLYGNKKGPLSVLSLSLS